MAFALLNLATPLAFIPHGHCYLWKPELVGLNLVSDALIALAYYSIPITLFYFVRKRQDLPFRWAFMLFAVFIIACGTTHLMDIWTLWHPTYWVAGALKAITAIASVSTAILLLPIIPKALALPSPAKLETANRKLQAEIAERQRLEKERNGFFKLSPDLLCITTFDGYFQYVNPAWETETGFTTEEILAKPYIDMFYADDHAALAADAQKVMAGIDTASYESRLQCKNGAAKWIAWSASAAPEERLVYVVGRNITERKQTEERLKLQSIILKNMAGGVCLVRTGDGEIAYTNPKFERMFGYDSGELNGKHVSILNYQSDQVDANEVTQTIMGTIQEQGEFTYEVHNIKKDGTPFWCQATASLLEHPEYGMVMVAVQYDVSDRKRVEQALRLSEERLQLALEGSGDGLWDWNIVNDKVYLSPQYVEMLGYKVGELPGDISTWNNLTHPEDQPWVMEILTAHLKDSSHPYTFDYRVRTKSGEWKWIGNYGKVVIRDEDGNPLRMTGTHKDISDRKRAEAERQTLMVKLQQSNHELEQFAFIASHDLREPLRTIRSFCSLLQSKHRDSLNEKGQDYLNRIQNATQRMQVLVNDLLSLSHVSTQSKPFLPVDLAKVVKEVTSGLQKQLQQTGGRVEVENLSTVHGDPTQLLQLFQNLISNALKFHRDVAPVVKISSQLQPATENANDSGFQQILVEDNGMGFDEKYGERIFEAFERLHGRGEYEGTGIGLSICKKIVERHGGNITVRSLIGHGSTFIITLPICLA